MIARSKMPASAFYDRFLKKSLMTSETPFSVSKQSSASISDVQENDRFDLLKSFGSAEKDDADAKRAVAFVDRQIGKSGTIVVTESPSLRSLISDAMKSGVKLHTVNGKVQVVESFI